MYLLLGTFFFLLTFSKEQNKFVPENGTVDKQNKKKFKKKREMSKERKKLKSTECMTHV
jgi:hypothetical protein